MRQVLSIVFFRWEGCGGDEVLAGGGELAAPEPLFEGIEDA